MAKGLQLKTAEVQRALRDLGRRAQKASQVGLGKLVEQTRAEVVAGVLGQRDLPRRVDTGRYVAAWKKPSEDRKTGAARLQASLSNDTPYAEEIEYGSRTMRPGLHLSRAIARVGSQAQDLLKTVLPPLLQGD